MCDTTISEFLAGVSLASIGVHAIIACFMRPKVVHVSFDPIDLMGMPRNTRSSYAHKSDDEVSSSSPSVEGSSGTSEKDEDDSTTRARSTLYSYFT